VNVTFLGTGTSQGVPVIACDCEVCTSVDFRDKRLRSSIHIEDKENSFVIDSGPDFRMQMLRARIKKLDALILTHQHKDHTAGLDDIRAFNFQQQIPMPVYGRKEVLEQIKKEFSYAFTDTKYPGIPSIDLQEIENKPFDIKETLFTPIEVMHFKLPVFGFRVNDFTYITDAKTIAPEELDKITGSKVIVLNALQQEAHISHFTLQEAIALLEKLNPQKAYLTHISHKMGRQREVEKKLPSFIKLAYDGLKFEV